MKKRNNQSTKASAVASKVKSKTKEFKVWYIPPGMDIPKDDNKKNKKCGCGETYDDNSKGRSDHRNTYKSSKDFGDVEKTLYVFYAEVPQQNDDPMKY